MKEANGEDVKLTEDRRGYLVEPTAQQIDDLMDAKRLVRDGAKYVLPPSRRPRARATRGFGRYFNLGAGLCPTH